MERIRYFNVETLSDLSKVKFSGDPGDTTYFTYSDTTLRQGTPDVAWHGVCTVAPMGQVYSHGKFYFPGRSGYSGTVYGVQWDTTDPSPDVTRIGNMSLHATLPVQGKMVGGTMADDGTFTEFSNQGDWTGEVRDGSIGQVMVRIPTFWIKFETWGDVYKVLVSAVPVVGFTMVKEMYVSAYEASLDRTNLKLSSVVNKTAQYRGGNNNSAWDNEDTAGEGGESHRSLLGRPATGISLTDFRNYARKRGSTAWNCYFYLMHKILYWLYVVEYATLNSQKAFNSELDSNGFHQGGLGDGVTTCNATDWNSFNSSYPFIPCGWTDNYGNGTINKNYSIYDGSGTIVNTFSVPRYRGIENPFGHIWKHVDGLLINVTSDTSDVYTTDMPDKFSSTSYNDYEFIGYGWRGDQKYIKELHLGSNGDVIAKNGEGSSTTYYCDYNRADTSQIEIKSLLIGGNSFDDTRSGLICSYSRNTPSSTMVSGGTRLTYFDAWKDVVYEEHEWLKGDGTAYIDTNVIVNVATLLISTKINRSNSTANFFIFGSRDIVRSDDPSTSSVVVSPQSFRCDIIDGNNIFDSSSIASIELSFPTLTINSQSLTTQRVPTTSQNTFRIFTTSVVNSETYCFNGGISGFVLNDGSHSLNLIPCRLLRSIPATLDANGIARDAGECGMWDKVGNKFYGNVAASGKFTVEGQKLYEEFDWLKGDGDAYIDTLNNYHPYEDSVRMIFRDNLYPNRATKYNKYNAEEQIWGTSKNGIHIRSYISGTTDITIGNNILDSNTSEQGVNWKGYTIDGGINDSEQHSIYISSVNNENKYSFTHNGSEKDNLSTRYVLPEIVQANVLVFNSKVVANGYFNGSFAYFIHYRNGDEILHLTPVRLLRPLPAYMDANGKPRAAGECGMWDKVYNKFYGNVATSGRFTVLNN